jgi:hypothetical protein
MFQILIHLLLVYLNNFGLLNALNEKKIIKRAKLFQMLILLRNIRQCIHKLENSFEISIF